MSDFKTITPMRYDEREEQMDPGRGKELQAQGLTAVPVSIDFTRHHVRANRPISGCCRFRSSCCSSGSGALAGAACDIGVWRERATLPVQRALRARSAICPSGSACSPRRPSSSSRSPGRTGRPRPFARAASTWSFSQDGSASMRVKDVAGDRWQRSMRFLRTLGDSLSWKTTASRWRSSRTSPRRRSG